MDGNSVRIKAVISNYLRRKSIDVIDKSLRSNLSEVDSLKVEKKLLTGEDISISTTLTNPLIIAKVKAATPVQSLVMTDLANDAFERFGSLAYQASCGSGKTFCGLLAVYRKKLKTLIISTRAAVIDQWKTTINHIYPSLRVYVGGDRLKKEETLQSFDIWIMTPQYLNIGDRILNLEIHPGLIIYDEIHSMLSQLNYKGPSKGKDVHVAEFANVLKLPFIKAKDWGQLPYLLSLSATYPKESLVKMIFGRIRSTPKDPITNIPISIYDLRRSQERRGKFDQNWKRPNEIETIKTFAYALFDQTVRDLALSKDFKVGPMTRDIVAHSKLISPCSKFKGLVMTHSVDASVWTALFLHKRFNLSILLLRTNDEKSYFFEKDKGLDFVFSDSVGLKEIKIGESDKDYTKYIPNSEIIVSTYQRVKEGFSVQNLVWSICTEFVWNPLTRVQLAGRIRRSSDDEELNKYSRVMYVCSGPVPNDLFTARKQHRQAQITYDFPFEEELFLRENYSYINEDASSFE